MRNCSHVGRISGFTLVELMIAITIVGILAAVAVPNMRTFLQNNRLATAGNDLLHGIQIARTEAIKRQQGSVVVCATADSTLADDALACSYGGNFSNWFVFYDANNSAQHDPGEAIFARGAASAQSTVRGDRNAVICFGPTGFAGVSCNGQNPTQNIVICDARGIVAVGPNSTARALFVSQTGRARVSQSYADVNTALTTIGGSCP